jgi:phage tail sheath protein FI
MAPRVSYPGVYVREVSGSPRPVERAPTSITAFLGRTARGPVNVPGTIRSFADFERRFGGLWLDSTVSFAIRDFFLHGGREAVIVRLFAPAPSPGSATPVTRARIALEGGLEIEAANEGAWGNQLRARVDHDTSGGNGDLFNLSVRDDSTGQIEVFRDLCTGVTHPRRVDRVLARESALVRAVGPLPGSRPAASAAVSAGADPFADASSTTATTLASDGVALSAPDYLGSRGNKEGLYALEEVDIFNLLCIPPFTLETDVDHTVWSAAAAYCEEKRAILLLDSPASWSTAARARSGLAAGLGTSSSNAALYFPRALQLNPLRHDHVEAFAPCGAIAGLIAATDARAGVWKAPAGRAAKFRNVTGFAVTLTSAELGLLNPLGINCLRSIPALGHMIWGARTMQGDNRRASEWKYLSVRRTALFIEQSLHRSLQWVVFEGNDETLWSAIRLSVGSFMSELYRSGAFRGESSDQAYFVKCDHETTTQADIERGRVKLYVGFAPLKPAEFVIIKIGKETRAGAV